MSDPSVGHVGIPLGDQKFESVFTDTSQAFTLGDKRLSSPFEPTLRFLCIHNREQLEALTKRIQFCLYPLRDWNVWTAEDRVPVLTMLRRGKDALDELMELLGEGVEGCK